jgi:hypothetical protein
MLLKRNTVLLLAFVPYNAKINLSLRSITKAEYPISSKPLFRRYIRSYSSIAFENSMGI